MTFQTTYYFGNQFAARQFARQATEISGGATLTETEGYWRIQDGSYDGSIHIDEGASVMTLHNGGIVGTKLIALARQAAADFGEAEVLEVTLEPIQARMIETKDYSA